MDARVTAAGVPTDPFAGEPLRCAIDVSSLLAPQPNSLISIDHGLPGLPKYSFFELSTPPSRLVIRYGSWAIWR